MYRLKNRQRLLTEILIALAISVIVNFSYFFFIFGTEQVSRGATGLNPIVTNHSGGYRYEINYLLMFVHIAYYFVLALLMVKISVPKPNQRFSFVKRLTLCLFIAVVFYLFTPTVNRDGVWTITLLARRILNPMTLLKSSFTVIVGVLYGKIYELIYQKQSVVMENQMLKTENLEAKYNTLVNQINPHFFFNSLNSLSMLVREQHNADALKYIDQLSDTFRYIIQNGEKGMTILEEELRFLDSYKYLFEIRYANKLFFRIDVPDSYKTWTLPSLSLQPLIENAVKHNTITTLSPLEITITTQDDCLVVTNQIHPKLEPEAGTKTGLTNLSSRYVLLTGRDIDVDNDGKQFCVTLPLTCPKQ